MIVTLPKPKNKKCVHASEVPHAVGCKTAIRWRCYFLGSCDNRFNQFCTAPEKGVTNENDKKVRK